MQLIHTLASKSAYWAVLLLAAVAPVTLATIAHRWLERPGIEGGRQFIRFVLPQR